MRAFSIVILIVVSMLMAACGLEQETVSNERSDVTLTIVLKTMDSANPLLLSALGTADDISEVTVDVYEGETALVTGQALTKSGNDYTGTITALPIGPLLTFITHAYNASSTEIFSGTTLQALTGVSDSVTTFLTPVDDGNGTILPAITKIEYINTIAPLSSEFIRFTVSGSLDEELSFQITAASGGGSFLPATGSIPIRSATATLVSKYTASDATGDYEHTILVSNAQGNSSSVTFNTVISTQYTNSDVDVFFYPVVAALGGKRVANDIIWTAVVSDDAPLDEIAYSWTFDGGLVFEDNTVNPATLLNYSTSVTGTLGLTVTDNYGSGSSTNISYSLPSGMFPDPGAVEEVGALDYVLPDSGQTQSYTSTFGEDSDYQGYSPSYTDNSADTVTDNITALTWQKDIDGTESNWADANAYCQNLTSSGFSDWRLPNLLEFKDIINYSVFSPAISTDYFNTDNDTNRYWSADTGTGTAGRLDFTRGTSSMEADTSLYYTRCVRGSAITPGTLTDNGDNTATDSVTGLIWQRTEGGSASWESALTYCETLSLGGFSDWRLPNIKELYTIVDLSTVPALNTTIFTGSASDIYWSSTTRTDGTGYAMVQDFSNGDITMGYKTGSANTRCVRGDF